MAGGRDSYKKFKQANKGNGLGTLYTAWHDRQVQKLNNLIEDEQFLEDVQMMKTEWSNTPLLQKIFALIVKYKLQVAMYELLENYFITGKVNPFVMRLPVVAIITKTKKAAPSFRINNGDALYKWIADEYKQQPDRFLFFWVDPDCTKDDMKQWVELWWSKVVKPMQEELRLAQSKRVRTSNHVKRDRYIQKEIREKKRPAKDVVKEVEGQVSEEYARQIAYRNLQGARRVINSLTLM